MWTSRWDDLLDQSQARRAKRWSEELGELSDIKVPRCLRLDRSVEAVTLHTFTDGSAGAYGAAKYVR